MKLKTFGSRFAFSFLLGAGLLGASALYAQNPRDDSKPDQQPESRPETQQEEKAPKPDQAKPEEKKDKQSPNEEKPANPKQNDKAMQQGKPAAQNRNAAGGGRIPDDKFRANFGRQHTFVVRQVTTVQGQPQFQYGGYSFILVEAWPVGWSYSDQCYIDYIDGQYFLYDLAHPGVQIALTVVL